MPYSGLITKISSKYHQTSHIFDERTWIAPDLVAELTWEQFAAGRDPVLEAIEEYRKAAG